MKLSTLVLVFSVFVASVSATTKCLFLTVNGSSDSQKQTLVNDGRGDGQCCSANIQFNGVQYRSIKPVLDSGGAWIKIFTDSACSSGEKDFPEDGHHLNVDADKQFSSPLSMNSVTYDFYFYKTNFKQCGSTVCSGSRSAIDASPSAAASPPSTTKIDEYIPFSGSVMVAHGKAILTAFIGGAFETALENVQLTATGVQVKAHAQAIITTPPPHVTSDTHQVLKSPDSTQSCMRQDDCPSKCAACIGLVRVCCGSGGTRGICLGVVSCPG